MHIKGIIYDFDGVICDSVNVKTEAFGALYESYGAEVQKQVVQYHLEHGGISRFEKIRYYQDTILGKPITEEKVLELADKFASLVKEKVISSPYIQYADRFIEKHSRNLHQYICTGTPEYEILEITDRKGIKDFFTGIYGAPKRKTQIIQEILSETGLQPSDFIYLGDAITDYEAAGAFAMPFIGVYSATTTFPADTNVIRDFSDSLLSEILA